MDTAFCMDVGVLEETFTTNVSGPTHVAQAFVGLVEKSAKRTIVNISSTLGSMGADPGAVHASYAVSKAGLNMLVRLLSPLHAPSRTADFAQTYKEAKEKPSLIVISMCPGSLQTGQCILVSRSRILLTRIHADMGGEGATYPVSVGVAGILKTVRSLKKEDSGTFFNFKGEHVPW